jgi:hypothetical protein
MFIKGNIFGLIQAAGSSHVFAVATDTTLDNVQFHHIGPNYDARGRARLCLTGDVWSVGDVLMETNNKASIATAATGLQTNGFCGISLEANDGTANNVCLVAEEGHGIVINSDLITVVPTGYSKFIKLSETTNGKATSSINIADGSIIAFCKSTTNGSGVPGTYSVHLFTPPMINRPRPIPVRTETGTSVTVSNLAARERYVRFTNAAPVTYTIPANATTPMPVGVPIRLFAAGSGGVTVSPASGVTLTGTATISQNTSRTLVQVATDQWDIY